MIAPAAYRPTLYTASKLHHAGLWQLLRDEHPEIEFTARWINHAPEMEATATPAMFGHYWTMDIQDVQRSDFTLLFAASFEEECELRGGLCEAGAALGAGKLVLAVNISERHSWSFHPRVVCFSAVADAFKFLATYSIAVSRIHALDTTTLDRG